MKIQVLATVGLGAFLLLSGCRGDSNANTATANRANSNMAANNTAVITTNANTSATPMADTATKTVIEEALKKKGFNDVTVDATTSSVTLRGSVAKGKMAEAVQAAQEAGRKPIKNELTEK